MELRKGRHLLGKAALMSHCYPGAALWWLLEVACEGYDFYEGYWSGVKVMELAHTHSKELAVSVSWCSGHLSSS